MIARRLTLAISVWLCVLACGLVAGVGSAGAVTQFGSFRYPYGVAVDQASGDVYVSDRYASRIDVFNGSGVLQGSFGSPGRGTGQFGTEEGPTGVAVDNEPGSLSYGDVYAVDWGDFRVEKFDSSGKFLAMFGGDVNETSGGNVCVAGEACKQGTQGTANGQFHWSFEGSYIAVGPDGRVYVGDLGRVQVFEASGVWRENISLTGLSSEGKVSSLVVNSAGDVFLKDEGVPGVREFEPDGVEMPVIFDQGSESVEAIALDESGDLLVADSTGGFHVLKYGPAGSLLDSFGSKTVSATSGIAVSDALNELYVVSVSAGGVSPLAIPPAGPWIEPGSESGSPGLRGAATLEAAVNPEGNSTTYRFEYVDAAQFDASGFAGASSTASTSIGSSFEDQHAEASLPTKALMPDTTYYWRVVASGSGHTYYGVTQSFEESPAVLVEGPWVSDVASTSATLAAKVDPLSSSTEYRLEWGTSTTYGHVFSGNIGEGLGYVSVGGFHMQGLEPDTTYHYRLIATNEMGTFESVDHEFTTQLGGEELSLPDGRSWELVSPADKKGALIQPLTDYRVTQAAADGGAIAYEASDVIGEDPVGKTNVSMILSARGPAGWSSEDISRPRNLPPEGYPAIFEELGGGYVALSSDLSSGVVEQNENYVRPLSSEATEKTPYLRNDLTCESQPQSCFTPLVSPGDVEPANAHFGGNGEKDSGFQVHVVGGTDDLNHVILQTPYPLTPEAVSGAEVGVKGAEGFTPQQNLYEWSTGRLQLVNILPDGESRPGATLGYQGRNEEVVAHSVSSDGRRVVWSFGVSVSGDIELFVRDMVKKRTVRIGGSGANYQTMSSDGSRIFYREGGELYELNLNTDEVSDITANHGEGETDAGVRDAVLGASEDGSYVYFVATGVLANGATSGAENLYASYDGAGGWSTSYIATLSNEDEKSWYANVEDQFSAEEGNGVNCNCGGVNHSGVSSRVSGNGHYVAFMSDRSLTGYDNTDAVSGQPDEEVFLYDAVAKRLVCASCDPTGARPVGVLDGHERLLTDPEDAWGARSEGGGTTTGEHWLAGMIPSWLRTWNGNSGVSLYQPRFLSDSGRLFFDSPDGLVPQATNGLMNVYEYEPTSVGSCTGASSTFSERSVGCVSLISSGTSSGESSFYDASETGDDVFFTTSGRLASEDYDNAYDVYDARVCTPEAPCPTAPVSPPPCTSGDSCKAAPSPQPELFGPAPSATFSGTGNLTPEAKASVKHKVKPVKCGKGFVKKHDKCVRIRKPKRAKAERAGNKRGAKR